jgi:hypothetical protein
MLNRYRKSEEWLKKCNGLLVKLKFYILLKFVIIVTFIWKEDKKLIIDEIY